MCATGVEGVYGSGYESAVITLSSISLTFQGERPHFNVAFVNSLILCKAVSREKPIQIQLSVFDPNILIFDESPHSRATP